MKRSEERRESGFEDTRAGGHEDQKRHMLKWRPETG
jgi:hypothetical protein